jgi:hypothetical protein
MHNRVNQNLSYKRQVFLNIDNFKKTGEKQCPINNPSERNDRKI